MHSKTYLFYLKITFLMLPSTECPPLLPVKGGKEEWQKMSFHVGSGCSFSQ